MVADSWLFRYGSRPFAGSKYVFEIFEKRRMRERLNNLHNQLGRDVHRELKYMRAFLNKSLSDISLRSERVNFDNERSTLLNCFYISAVWDYVRWFIIAMVKKERYFNVQKRKDDGAFIKYREG